MAAINVVKKFFPKVKTVLDATRNATIIVTNKDSQTKAVKDHSACAMAVACKRKFHLDGVIISRSIAYLIKGKQARRFKLPESVSREVISFDRGGGFAPGKYELSKPPKSMTFGYHTGGRHKLPRSESIVKATRHLTTNVRSVLGGQKPEEKGEA